MFSTKFKINERKGTITYQRFNTWRKHVVPIVGTTVTFDDPGKERRGFTLSTGIIGMGRDKGNVYVTISRDGNAEVLSFPRKYKAIVEDVRRKVAKIAAINAFANALEAERQRQINWYDWERRNRRMS